MISRFQCAFVCFCMFLTADVWSYGSSGSDNNDKGFVPLYYPKPVPSESDFYYSPLSSNDLYGLQGKYPTFNRVPVTHFSCRDYPYPGYFADEVTGCQVYHVCTSDGRRSSFLCPNQTVFNQQVLVCDWWYNVDCQNSNEYYYLNSYKFTEHYSKPIQKEVSYSHPFSYDHKVINYGRNQDNNNNNYHHRQVVSPKQSYQSTYSTLKYDEDDYTNNVPLNNNYATEQKNSNYWNHQESKPEHGNNIHYNQQESNPEKLQGNYQNVEQQTYYSQQQNYPTNEDLHFAASNHSEIIAKVEDPSNKTSNHTSA